MGDSKMAGREKRREVLIGSLKGVFRVQRLIHIVIIHGMLIFHLSDQTNSYPTFAENHSGTNSGIQLASMAVTPR